VTTDATTIELTSDGGVDLVLKPPPPPPAAAAAAAAAAVETCSF